MTAVLTAAERILQSLGVTDPKEIDLEAIAWTQRVVVNYRPLDGCEARIIGSSRKAVISVNSRSPERRRRFSLAHELGHYAESSVMPRRSGVARKARPDRCSMRHNQSDSRKLSRASSGLYRPGRAMVDATRAKAFSLRRMSAWT